MLRYAADENFNNDILRGLRRRDDELDVLRAQDAELSGALDPIVLEWAARENRVLLSHDVSTMIGFVYDRVRRGESTTSVECALASFPSAPIRLPLVPA